MPTKEQVDRLKQYALPLTLCIFLFLEVYFLFLHPSSFVSEVSMRDVKAYAKSIVNSIGKGEAISLAPQNSTHLGLNPDSSARIKLNVTKIDVDDLWVRGETMDENDMAISMWFRLPNSFSWIEFIQPRDQVTLIIHRVTDKPAHAYEEIFPWYYYHINLSWRDSGRYVLFSLEDHSLNRNETFIKIEEIERVGWYDNIAFWPGTFTLIFVAVLIAISNHRRRAQESENGGSVPIAILLIVHYVLFLIFYSQFVPQLNNQAFNLPGVAILESRADDWWRVRLLAPLLLLTFPQACLFYLGKSEPFLDRYRSNTCREKDSRFLSDLIRSLALLSITVTISALLFPKPLAGRPESNLIMILVRVAILILAVFAGLFSLSWGLNSRERENVFLGLGLTVVMGALVGTVCSAFVSGFPSFMLVCSLASVVPLIPYLLSKM